MKSFKIKVYNPDISKVVQEKLFSLNYSWYVFIDSKWIPTKEVRYTEFKYLFTIDENGEIEGDDREGTFRSSPLSELTINELMEMEPEQPKKIEKLSMDHDCGGQQMEIRDKINQLIDDINKLNEKIDI